MVYDIHDFESLIHWICNYDLTENQIQEMKKLFSKEDIEYIEDQINDLIQEFDNNLPKDSLTSITDSIFDNNKELESKFDELYKKFKDLNKN